MLLNHLEFKSQTLELKLQLLVVNVAIKFAKLITEVHSTTTST